MALTHYQRNDTEMEKDRCSPCTWCDKTCYSTDSNHSHHLFLNLCLYWGISKWDNLSPVFSTYRTSSLIKGLSRCSNCMQSISDLRSLEAAAPSGHLNVLLPHNKRNKLHPVSTQKCTYRSNTSQTLPLCWLSQGVSPISGLSVWCMSAVH